MSWYYVGPDAKPVGPISLEDLQTRRGSGAIGPDTYVIEAPAGSAPKEWRRFRDVFPPAPILPPLPTGAASPPPILPTMGVPHPIFPTTPPVAPSPGGPVFTGSHPSTYHLPPRHNNAWCLWGFGLGLASLPLLLLCGIGVFAAIAGLVASIVGLIQVGHHREQHGRGLAVAGLILSLLALLCALAIGVGVAMSGPMAQRSANDNRADLQRLRHPMISPRWTIALGACACAAVGAYTFAIEPETGAYPHCLLYAATGYYCAGCGATRALHALLHGRVLAALHDNVLFVLLLPAALVLIWRIAAPAWQHNRWPTDPVKPRPFLLRAAALVIVAAIFMALRNIPGAPFDLCDPLPSAKPASEGSRRPERRSLIEHRMTANPAPAQARRR